MGAFLTDQAFLPTGYNIAVLQLGGGGMMLATNASKAYSTITLLLVFLSSSAGAVELIDVNDYVGLDRATAEANIVSDGLTVGTVTEVNNAAAAGTVIGQSPAACSECAAPGDPVDLTVSLGPLVKSVTIDIRPGSDGNEINTRSRGVIPVAILGSDSFDVADVDLATLAFGLPPTATTYETAQSGSIDGQIIDGIEYTSNSAQVVTDILSTQNLSNPVVLSDPTSKTVTLLFPAAVTSIEYDFVTAPQAATVTAASTIELFDAQYNLLDIVTADGADPGCCFGLPEGRMAVTGTGIRSALIRFKNTENQGAFDNLRVTYAGIASEQRQGGQYEYVNGDGFLDLLSRYRTQDIGIYNGVNTLCLTGELIDGTPFEGCDSVNILPPKTQ